MLSLGKQCASLFMEDASRGSGSEAVSPAACTRNKTEPGMQGVISLFMCIVVACRSPSHRPRPHGARRRKNTEQKICPKEQGGRKALEGLMKALVSSRYNWMLELGVTLHSPFRTSLCSTPLGECGHYTCCAAGAK